MKKINLIAAVCLGITTMANAETKLNLNSEKLLPSASSKPFSINKTNEGEKKLAHVIKLNASQLALKNISLQYELGFHKNMSVALGYSNLLSRTLPKQFVTSAKAAGYDLPSFKGYSLTPEFRFYPGKKEENPAPHGFYLAPYMRYAKYTLSASYDQKDPITNVFISKYDVTGTYKGSTVGLMLGSQWIVGKHFSFDWWILGGGVGKAKLILEAESSGINLSAQAQNDLKTDITDNVGELGSFSNGDVSVETTSNSAKVTISGVPMTSIRGALVAGFNFGFKF